MTVVSFTDGRRRGTSGGPLRGILDRDSVAVALPGFGTGRPDGFTATRPGRSGVPNELAREIGTAHDEVMSRSILDFYRSAAPNVSGGWWEEITGPTRSRGLVPLLPDPPEVDAMSLEVAERLRAETVRLDDLNHRWMAEAPELVALVLQRFWSSLN